MLDSCTRSLQTAACMADWVGDIDYHHSTTGNVSVISATTISWLSKKQPVVALSTTEAEYNALCTAAQEPIWLRRLLTDIKAPEINCHQRA